MNKETPPELSPKANLVVNLIAGAFFSIIPLAFIGGMVSAWWNSPPRAEREATHRAEAEAEAAKKEEENYKGWHCLSQWDGSHSGLVNEVKQALRDPSSFRHIGTHISPKGSNGQHDISMSYSATNGFGGYVTEYISGTVNNVTCRVTVTGSF